MTLRQPRGRLLSTHLAARRLGVHRQTVYRAINDGRLPAERDGVNGRWRIRELALEALAAELVRGER